MIFGNRNKYIEKVPYFEKDNCPFCNYDTEEEELILLKTKYWEIRYNKYPYYGYKQNLLAFPIEHKSFTTELTDEEILDYKNVEIYMKDYFLEKNYFSLIRQGTGGRSIEHLHYHYLEGVIYHNPDDKESFKIINIS